MSGSSGRGAWARPDAVALFGLLLAQAWVLWPLLAPPFGPEAIVGSDSYRSHDWLEVAKFERYARDAVLEHGRLAQWNPLLAGGHPQLGHPSDGSLSPLFLSSLVFGEVLGLKLNVALVALLGTLGVYGIARRNLGLSAGAAFAAALTWCWAGWLPSRVAVGFYESTLMAAWPAILALWAMPGTLQARRRRWVLAAVLLASLAMQLQLAVPVLVLWMAALAASLSLQQWVRGEPLDRALLWGAAAVLGLGAVLGAVKFAPMLRLLASSGFRSAPLYPTHPDAWYRNLAQLAYALTHHVPGVPLTDSDGNPRVQEYMTMQPALGGLLLAGAGLLTLRRHPRAWPWVGTSALFLWLCFGPHAPVDGFRPLHELPLFGSMRGPLRYLNLPALMGLCLLAGLGWTALERSRWRVGAGLVGAVAAALALRTGTDVRTLHRSSFRYQAEELEPTQRSEGLAGRSSGIAWRLNLRKYGNVVRGAPTVYMPEDLPMAVGAVPARWLAEDGSDPREPRYRGEAHTVSARSLAGGEPPPGVVRLESLLPQELVVRHDVAAGTAVVVNQNRDPGWRCDAPRDEELEGWTGRLVFVAPGPGQTACRWREPALGPGAAASGLGVLGLLVLWPRRRTGRRR